MKKITKRFMHKGKQIMVRLKPFSLPVLIVVVAVSAVVGIKVIFRSHAATQISTTTTNNSANRIIISASWNSFNYCTTKASNCYTDSDFAALHNWGIGGIAMPIPGSKLLGGTYQYTGDQTKMTSDPSWDVERSMLQTQVVSIAKSHGLKVYFNIGLSVPTDHETPLCHWTDDTCWNNQALPALSGIAGMAKLLGADGIYFDGEGYNQPSTWNWDWTAEPNASTVSYNGLVGEPAVRSAAKKRGNQIMATMLAAYPNLDFSMYYGNQFPESYVALVQQVINHAVNPYANSLQTNWFDGMTSAEGYSHIRILDHTFYKTNKPGANFDVDNQYNNGTVMAYASRNFSDWNYAASRFSINPYIWLDSSNSVGYDSPIDPTVAASMLMNYRKWALDGEFEDFSYADPINGPYPTQFLAVCNCPGQNPYTPYFPGLQAAAVLGTVDSTPPTLNVTSPASGSASTSANSITIAGTASDDLAVRYISWSNDRGGAGNFAMTYQTAMSASNYSQSSYTGQQNFSGSIPLQSGTNNITVTAVDIHGNTTRQVVPITSGGTGDNPPAVSLAASPTTLTQGSATTLTATATDTDSTPVAKVEFYDGATLLGTSTAAPYTYTWTTTTSTSTGGHNLTAKAYDTANLNATSAAVAVTVNAPASGNAINDNTTGTSTNQFNYSGSPGTWTYVATNCAGAGITYQGDCHYNGTNGSYYQVAFTGTGVNVYSFKAGDAALLDIYIDGVLKQSGVDTYSPSIQASAIVASITGLTNAAHTLKVVANGKNAASSGFSNNADRVDVITSTTTKPGDVNGDGAVNITDLSILTAYFGQSGRTLATGDLNGDGVVNIIDLSILATHWGT